LCITTDISFFHITASVSSQHIHSRIFVFLQWNCLIATFFTADASSQKFVGFSTWSSFATWHHKPCISRAVGLRALQVRMQVMRSRASAKYQPYFGRIVNMCWCYSALQFVVSSKYAFYNRARSAYIRSNDIASCT